MSHLTAVAELLDTAPCFLPAQGLVYHKSVSVSSVLPARPNNGDEQSDGVVVYTFGGFIGGDSCTYSNQLTVMNMKTMEWRHITPSNKQMKQERTSFHENYDESDDDSDEDFTVSDSGTADEDDGGDEFSDFDDEVQLSTNMVRLEKLTLHHSLNQLSTRSNREKIVIVDNECWPCARINHSLEYDPVGHCLLLFGGMDQNEQYLNDLYIYHINDEKWTKRQIIGESSSVNWPCVRSGHATCVYNAFMIVSGGITENDRVLNDVWILDLRAWQWTQMQFSQSTPNAVVDTPCARYGHKMVARPSESSIIMLGGENQFETLLSDMHLLRMVQLDTDDKLMIDSNSCYWTEIECNSSIIPRPSHFLSLFISIDIKDRSNDKLFMIGNVDINDQCCNSSIWCFDLGTKQWSETIIELRNKNETVIPPRIYHSSVMFRTSDSVKHTILVIGGCEHASDLTFTSNSIYRITIADETLH